MSISCLKYLFVFAGVSALILWLTAPASAENTNIKSSIVSALSDKYVTQKTGNKNCGKLLNNLRLGHFDVLAPVATSQSVYDIAVKQWTACIPEGVLGDTGTLRRTIIRCLTDENFAAYQAELDGNPDNGQELILHADHAHAAPGTGCWVGEDTRIYRAVNPFSCQNLNRNPIAADLVDEKKYIINESANFINYGDRNAWDGLLSVRNAYISIDFDKGNFLSVEIISADGNLDLVARNANSLYSFSFNASKNSQICTWQVQ